MQPLRLAFLFALVNAVAPAGPLRVLRVYPTENADPLTEVVITFDRPVAGGLDSTVPAERIFRIQPAIAGKLEWRDPVTIRFRPDAPLTPGNSYTISIANQFEAMDGSVLEEPYTHTFRVRPATIITGDPVNPHQTARFLPRQPTFRLLLSAPTDPRRVASSLSIALPQQCGARNIGLNVVQMRRVNERDPGVLRWSGRASAFGDTLRDLRRVLEVTPSAPLPLGCTAALVVPAELAEGGAEFRWPFQTYGALQVLRSQCAYSRVCPTGPIEVAFTTPVRGSEVQKRVRVAPFINFTVRDTTDESDVWILETTLEPRHGYSVIVDPELTDVFGQRLGTQSVKAFMTTSYTSIVSHQTGRMLVERQGLRTLAAEVVNVDSVSVTTIAIPQSAEADFLSRTWNWEEPFQALATSATTRTIPVNKVLDKPFVVAVPFTPNDARTSPNGTLVAVQIKRAGGGPVKTEELSGIALIQVTDLAVHGRVGIDDGYVWVTGVRDGQARANVNVTLYDRTGKVRATARTNAQGLARLTNFRAPDAESACEGWCGGFEGYIAAVLNDDRAVVGLTSNDPDLAPWRFDVWSAWNDEMRIPAAVAVFTERGIYRPGERVYAKAIVRRGPLGALTIPTRGDSLKWTFSDRESGVIKETTTGLSAFGTADQSLQLGSELPLGQYSIQLALKHEGSWKNLASTQYQVAEYRPPEFLVEVNADQAPRFAGDSLSAQVTARYLFGAPMANSPVRYVVQQRTLFPWDLNIPNTEGWQIGGYGDFDEFYGGDDVVVAAEGADTLDAKGAVTLMVALPKPRDGRGARTGIIAVVTDANRQSVAAGRSVVVHPAAFYIGAKDRGNDYFWRAGRPVTIDVMAVRPTGERVANVAVTGVVVRREWHNARRTRNGQTQEIGGWVTDTVASCRVTTTAADGAGCQFTPTEGGSYQVSLTATDPQRREARTTLYRWAAGTGTVPWRDDNKLRVDLIADKQRYTVGDTATLLLASPFTNVEAWLTVERERVLESRRLRITSGAMTIKVPITEALAPNAFVSILMVRGRSAAPGPLDDPGRPTMRVGYATLRVEPAVKRLNVEVKALQAEYRPGDSARVQVNVRDTRGAGQRSEVTLWAVDEGVLALTGYQTPDPLALLYQERGLGVRLASNLTSVAPQVPAGQKGRAPGGGGGADISAILRSRFQTTAFFLGSVQTDANGSALVSAKLPDNLTTFRIMAVAVTANDRYGSGQAPMLVTRPLVARAALPRFVREGDRFAAGVVVNQRIGGTQRVEVAASARGITLDGAKSKTETLNGAAAREVKFNFQAQPGDSARFQFSARAGNKADAVALSIPVRPNYYPLAQTIAGVLRDTATAEFQLDPQVDPARSTLELSFGSSAYSVIEGVRRSLRVYPYYCTEQVSSTALPLIALASAQRQIGGAPEARATYDIETAIRTISRRQRPDGAIGYWSPSDWSSPWLTAYAARVLLEARSAGFTVDSLVLSRVGEYLTRTLREQEVVRFAVSYWYSDSRMQLSDRVAAVDILSRLNRPDVAMENSLLSQAAQLRWEDRVLLAEVLARRGQSVPAQTLLANAWQGARLEGRRVTLPAEDRPHYFPSRARPAARLLTATLAIDPTNALLGPLVETLVLQGKTAAASFWNTQDYGYTVLALMAFERTRTDAGQGTITFRSSSGTLLKRDLAAGAQRDTTFTLNKLVDKRGRLHINISAANGAPPVFYYLTVREVPKVRPVTPVDRGIQVERWYERVDSPTPVVSVAAGDVVRVRVRITLPAERHFVVVNDPLPAGLEAVDLSLRTVSPFSGWGEFALPEQRGEPQEESSWYYGSWDSGMWSPFDHKELRDDRVVYSATVLWKGRYTATYLARATTAGVFIVPPAHAEEMYNPAVNGRTGGSTFTVR